MWDDLLLNVWREACRHIDLAASVAALAELLRPHLPLQALLVREIDADDATVETIAEAITDCNPRPAARNPLSGDELAAALAWSAAAEGSSAAEIIDFRAGDAVAGRLSSVFPSGVCGAALAGPLGKQHGRCGLIVLIAAEGRALLPAHLDLLRRLLEPIAVALANSERVRELHALREAAEADRQSLLARLGRRGLGETIIGAESGLRGVMDRAELVARSDVPVLIFGETGSGKEVLARAIHTRSTRGEGPFLRVNCGAIPAELIDSQLFGHERGAFTGAIETRKGWFERADGGTLLLDEIGELPPAAQVRLLRILQDGWLERVGGHQPIHVDVRIVAATHRDLAAMVADGRFREDLWYRIAVFSIVLPPLRERREDIAALARHFAQRAAVRFGLPLAMPDDHAIALLCDYAWPGNVRELSTVIDRAAILGEGRRLEVAQALGVAAPRTAAVSAMAAPPPSPPAGVPGAQVLSLDAAIAAHIEAALRLTCGRIEGPRGAAALLRVNPHTLRGKMRKLGIDWQRFRGENPL